MSNHEDILDNGEYICIKCGIVLGQEYIYKESCFNDQIKKKKLLECIQEPITFYNVFS